MPREVSNRLPCKKFSKTVLSQAPVHIFEGEYTNVITQTLNELEVTLKTCFTVIII